MKRLPGSLVWFYLLVLYISVQLIWWAVNIVNLSYQVYSGREATNHLWMIVGEGSVFFILMLLAIWRLHKGMNREMRLNQEHRNFLLSTTHELKTPIAAVKLYLQTMQKRDLEADKRQDVLAKALEENDRLNEMIEKMLLASRMENNIKSVDVREGDLSACVESVMKQLRIHFNSREVNIGIEQGIRAEFDQEALYSILSNTVENAVKYSQTGEILVTLKRSNGGFVLAIVDQGPGIARKDAVTRLFYREQSEETRTNKGSGLGLYIVDQLCRQQGFNLKIRDGETGGTIIEITGSTI